MSEISLSDQCHFRFKTDLSEKSENTAAEVTFMSGFSVVLRPVMVGDVATVRVEYTNETGRVYTVKPFFSIGGDETIAIEEFVMEGNGVKEIETDCRQQDLLLVDFLFFYD